MKTILITGANKGIGFETARQLIEKGHRVIMSGRSQEKVSKAVDTLSEKDGRAHSLVMDVTDRRSIAEAAKRCKSEYGTIDVLINNAAILLKADKALSSDNMEVFEQTMKTNVFGPLLVTRSFLPLLNKPGRIVNVSSFGGSMSQEVGGWAPAYCASKTALNGMTRQLAHELRSEEISVNALHPGWVHTDMGGSAAPRSISKGAETPVWLAVEADDAITGSFFHDMKEVPW